MPPLLVWADHRGYLNVAGRVNTSGALRLAGRSGLLRAAAIATFTPARRDQPIGLAMVRAR
jgi:hypothetical protein